MVDVELKIKLEPGFVEKFRSAENQIGKNPIGYQECKRLQKHHNRLNCNYKSIFNREMISKYKKVIE